MKPNTDGKIWSSLIPRKWGATHDTHNDVLDRHSSREPRLYFLFFSNYGKPAISRRPVIIILFQLVRDFSTKDSGEKTDTQDKKLHSSTAGKQK